MRLALLLLVFVAGCHGAAGIRPRPDPLPILPNDHAACPCGVCTVVDWKYVAPIPE